MRLAAPLIAILYLVGCSQGSPTATVTSTPSPTSAATATPSSSAAAACTPTSSYGLLIVSNQLQIIDTCAKVKASAPIAPGSLQQCAAGGPAANLAPPVSATADRVYYRGGDTKIRFLTVDGQTGDATTVPGSATSVSFFSVSPDDKRIAVLVESISGASTALRLYVEDLQGGTNHADIYSTAVSTGGGNTLWPMGWHGGQLVLALVPLCGAPSYGVSVVEWHVVDPATGNRLVNISSTCLGGPGLLSRWPSPGGVICTDFQYGLTFYNWTGKSFLGIGGLREADDSQTGLSPSGDRYFIGGQTTGHYCPVFLTPPSTCIYGEMLIGTSGFPGPRAVACLFIDETHLLTPQGVIDGHHGGNLIQFPMAGTCAGRFPGGL